MLTKFVYKNSDRSDSQFGIFTRCEKHIETHVRNKHTGDYINDAYLLAYVGPPNKGETCGFCDGEIADYFVDADAVAGETQPLIHEEPEYLTW